MRRGCTRALGWGGRTAGGGRGVRRGAAGRARRRIGRATLDPTLGACGGGATALVLRLLRASSPRTPLPPPPLQRISATGSHVVLLEAATMKLPVGYVPGHGVVKASGFGGYGQRMLERMGWEKGQGLGRDKSGMKDAIEVKKKEDTRGKAKEKEKERKRMRDGPRRRRGDACAPPRARQLRRLVVGGTGRVGGDEHPGTAMAAAAAAPPPAPPLRSLLPAMTSEIRRSSRFVRPSRC
eukprot:109458-Chlamydomonas_euryale.AAC.1